MEIGRNVIVIIAIVLALLLLIAIIAASRFNSSNKQILPCPHDVKSIQIYGGYILTWDHPKYTTSNIYIFTGPNDSISNASRTIVGVQSPYFLTDYFLLPGQNYIGITTSNHHSTSKMCDLYHLDLGSSMLPAPILNCHGAFNFEGQFEADAETCFQQSADDRIVLRWYPVQGAQSYKIYVNEGSSVSKTNNVQTHSLPRTAYYYTSDPLNSSSCWSFIVTAIDVLGRETNPSQTFTTCSVV